MKNHIDRRIFLAGLAGAGFAGAAPVLAARKKKEVRAVSLGRSGDRANDGYDATAYVSSGAARSGSPEFELDWKGATWRFESAAARAAFEQAPQSFAPQFGGYCTYAMSLRKIVPADPEVWRIRDGQLYLFAAKPGAVKFDKGAAAMIAKAHAYWTTLALVE